MNVLRFRPASLVLAAMLLACPARAEEGQAEAEKAQPGPKAEGGKAKAKGKWVLISPDGQKIEIDLGEGGKKVIPLHVPGVPATAWTTRVGGKTLFIGPDGKKIEVEPGKAVQGFPLPMSPVSPKGKMLFVGPDGKTREIELSKFSGAAGAYQLYALQGTSDFMLGLDCTPADEALQAHLGLDKGVGLVVRSALEGTPANKAGLQRHDVLVSANETPLSSLADLVKAVQEAGKEGKSVKLGIIRAGKKASVEVTPTKRKPPQFQLEGKKGVEGQKGLGGFYRFRGFPSPGGEQLEKRVEELAKKVEELEKAVEKLRKDE